MLKKILACAICIFADLSVAATAPAPKPNVILITLDGARPDHVGFLGPHPEAKSAPTPNLDRLAANSIVFDRAYAQAPGTVVSHATILSGAYPQTVGVSQVGGTLPPSLPYLPDLLLKQDYRTAAFVGTVALDPINGPAQGFDRGFQLYDAGFRPMAPGDYPALTSARHGDEVVFRATAWLRKNSQSHFFLWIHIADADLRPPGVSYNSALTDADAAVGKLIKNLQQQKLYEDSAIILAASSGESLGEHNEDGHGIFLYDDTIHVPLLLKLPASQSVGKTATARVAAKVRLVDIAPTLLEISGIAVPSQMAGQSLLRIAKAGAAGGDQPVYSRSDLPQRAFGWSPLESWRAGKYLYIRAPKPELYDLSADPSAAHNLAQTSKATLDTMSAQLDNFDRHFAPDAAKPSAELTTSEIQKLASLGYVGLQKSSAAAATVAGTDPKDKIAVANKVLAAETREQFSPHPSSPRQSKPRTALAHAPMSDQLIATLKTIVAADQNLYLAEYTLGLTESRLAQYAEAARHFHKAIELQPDSAWAHYAMGATLLKTGDFKTAIIHLQIAADRLPKFTPAHTTLAEAQSQAKSPNGPHP